MRTLINVRFPINMAKETSRLFEPYSSYEVPVVKVKHLKNVFVSFSGLCINKGGLIKECHHDFSSQMKNYVNEAAFYYYSCVDNPQNLITLDDDRTYLAIHHPWFNYYHWISESIFRLWMVRRKKNLILILPEYYKNADFINGSLEPFAIKEIFYIPQDKSLLVRNLCLPQIKPQCDAYNKVHLRRVRQFYINYVTKIKPIKFDKIDRLFVSRKFAGRRQIINESQVELVLQKYEFTIFYPEKFTFLEQVAIFSHVEYLIGGHGSGLTNILFMREHTSVLELHKSKTNELDHPSPLFWYMASALDIAYFHQVCDLEGDEDYFMGDYFVDIQALENNIIRMLEGPNSFST